VVITANEELLSPEQAGERLGVSVYTVRRWIKEGRLRAFKPGKEYRIRASDLEEFLRAREVRPKAPRRSPFEPSFNDVLAGEERPEASSQPRTRSGAEGHLTIRRTPEDLAENLTAEQVREILEGVRDGRITVDAAERRIAKLIAESA
jgi:excisionase family DNA binding protein